MIDLLNKTFNKLTVIELLPLVPNKPRKWKCICSCGSTATTTSYALRSGHTKSCGCIQKEKIKTLNLSHGKTGSAEIKIWYKMRDRCMNPKSKSYKHYGARGISICNRWMDSSLFLSDMGTRPSPHHSIDRIDVNGNYEPSNCRWTTHTQQANNRRNTKQYTYNNDTKTIPEWCKALNLNYKNVNLRISQKWSIHRALSTPTNKPFIPLN